MKAMQFSAYGGPERLAPAEAPMPEPAAGQLRVGIAATSVNPIDWKLHSGMLRWVKPIRFPSTPCFDFAGRITAVGPGLSGWTEGEGVFGMLPIGALGAAAEAVVVDARFACQIPAGLAVHAVAGLPLAGMTALQGLRDQGRLQAGQNLLVIGGAGGVGHYAVQIGKILGARVTAVCGPGNLEFCRSLGADAVLDYTQTDLRPPAAAFDLILDCAGHAPFSRWRLALGPAGRFVALLPSPALGFQALRLRLSGRQRIGFIFVQPRQADLAWLAERMREGVLRTVIDQVFPLEDLAAALAKSRAGHVRGKLIVAVTG